MLRVCSFRNQGVSEGGGSGGVDAAEGLDGLGLDAGGAAVSTGGRMRADEDVGDPGGQISMGVK